VHARGVLLKLVRVGVPLPLIFFFLVFLAKRLGKKMVWVSVVFFALVFCLHRCVPPFTQLLCYNSFFMKFTSEGYFLSFTFMRSRRCGSTNSRPVQAELLYTFLVIT
jgi:hypothetical protein